MKRMMAVLVCLIAFVSVSMADTETWHQGKADQKSFASGGTIQLRLGAGEATVIIKPDATEIKVTTESKREDKLKDIRLEIKTVGSKAEVSVHGPGKGFRYKIEIPSSANLQLRMSAGDLTVKGIDGNFDGELHAGDCTLELGTAAENFGPIQLSVKAGDVEAAPFKASKGGLFRHFHDDRTAKFKFHAHVGAGDLTVK